MILFEAMADQKLYSRSELIAISGAPEDAVVFWIRQGLLQSATEGQRKHLRFDRTEVKLAALLREARAMGLNVDIMRQLVAEVRAGVGVWRQFDGWSVEDRFYLRNALDSQTFFESWDEAIKQVFPEARTEFDDLYPKFAAKGGNIDAVASRLGNWSEADSRRFGIGCNFDQSEGFLTLQRGAGGKALLKYNMPDEGDIAAASAILFNLDLILKLEWPQ